MAETMIAVTVQAAKDKYVCNIARSCSGPSTRAELNDGQKIHKKLLRNRCGKFILLIKLSYTEPTIAKISELYDAPSSSPAFAFSFFGRKTKLHASPKYAPKA